MGNDSKKKFDLHSQQGVADLLRQVRASALPLSMKTTIREMVLRYTQRGGDVGVREELEALLQSVNLTPSTIVTPGTQNESETLTTQPTLEEKVEKPVGMAGTRPVPLFGVSKKSFSIPTPAPEPVVSTTVPVSTTQQPPVADPAPVASPEPQPAQSVVVTPEPITPPSPVSNPAPAPVVPEPIAPPVDIPPAPASAMVPPDIAASVLANTDYAARIQEIKREVIAMIGNPVNLIDIDNTVGKQYMTALVEAMKKVNGGTKIEAATAMASLETAYAAVKALIDARVASAVSAATAQPVAAPIADPVAAHTVSSAPPAAPVPPPPPAFTPRSVPTEAELKPVKESTVAKETPGVHENLAAEESLEWEGEALQKIDAVAAAPAPAKAAIPLQDIPNYGYAATETKETPVEKEEVPATPATPGEYETSLMTPAITAGLSQLLAEWKIFKSSGLFGMGPSGIEHPLYQRIKQSTMLTISNGTFDGADTEVLQSINDYINGWRYERSIIPQHTETFEHFLRRVVKKILEDTKEHIV